ncbi:MmcQ/YjbR family DNA-binding protein [Micromonospora echinaurantiaca]|uniref:MmcQ/YjbR family DNA-binding protein n=1 Tax=Micromonospora echinaurantiaca TaxID=47857 RepID=UPI0037ADC534
MSAPADVPPEFLDRLRPICRSLPDAYEEPAWVGIRWRVRKRTFAHALTVDPDHQAAYARAVATDEPTCVLTFRAPVDEVHALVAGGHPFYKPDWAADVLGMVLDDGVDWDEVGELLTESYCRLAPKKLAAQVSRPTPASR